MPLTWEATEEEAHVSLNGAPLVVLSNEADCGDKKEMVGEIRFPQVAECKHVVYVDGIGNISRPGRRVPKH